MKAGKSTELKSGLSLLLGFSLSTLVAIELILRLFFYQPFHEWMEWVPDGHIKGRGRPFSSFKTESGDIVEINRLGFRGQTPSWHPEPGTVRVLLLGGSAAFSYHSSGEENTWSELLEKELSAVLEQPVEIINLALPGFDSATAIRNYLSTGRALHPHVVLLYETWNDMKFFRSIPAEPERLAIAAIADHNKPLWQRIARYSQIAIHIRNALLQAQKRKRENSYTSLEALGDQANVPVSAEAIAWERKNFEDFAALVRSDGALPVLISQANLLHAENIDDAHVRVAVDNDLVGMTLPVYIDTLERVRVTMREVAQRFAIPFIDTYPKIPADLKHFFDHVHLRAAGDRALAELLAKEMLAMPAFRGIVAVHAPTRNAETQSEVTREEGQD